MIIPQHLLSQIKSTIHDKNIPIEIVCKCGITQTINLRSLIRKWKDKSEYLCKSCSVKSYASNPEKIEKFKISYSKISQTKEHKEICSKNGRKSWENQETRQKLIETIRNDNLENPKKKESRAIALKAFLNTNYRKHLSEIRKIANETIRYRCKNDKQYIENLLLRLQLDKPETKEKHRISTNKATKKRWETNEFKEQIAIIRTNQLKQSSSIQLQLYKYLDDLNIVYYKEGHATRKGYYVFDCIIPLLNNKELLIECQGDYWHDENKNPKCVKNDRAKFTYIDRYFPESEIMYIWEHEFNAKDRVLDRLQLKLGLKIETIEFNFRDVEIKLISGNDIKSFLDAYHYIGKNRGGKVYGAYYNNQLIACVVFSPPVRQNLSKQFNNLEIIELSRFCIHPSYHKKNFASWFISRTINLISNKLIIAYSDKTIGHTGTIYKASNFIYHHTVPSNYWYIDKDGYIMHKKTLYSKARKLRMTETQFAIEKGYNRKYGGEKSCFIYSKNKLILERASKTCQRSHLD